MKNKKMTAMRLICLVLSMLMLFSLAACGEDKKGGSQKGPGKVENKKNYDPDADAPSQEEAELLVRYRDILEELEKYILRGGNPDDITYKAPGETEPYTGPTGGVAIYRYYQELQGMECLDKWLEMPGFLDEYEPFQYDNSIIYLYGEKYSLEICSRRELLARFTILEDVAVEQNVQTVDKDAKLWTGHDFLWHYNKDGILSSMSGRDESNPMYLHYANGYYRFRMTYDDAGNLTCREWIEGDSWEAEATATFNYENGRVVEEYVTVHGDENENQLYTYIYDTNGRVTQVDGSGGEYVYSPRSVRTYAYDSLGRVIIDELTTYKHQENKDKGLIGMKYRMEYTYAEGDLPVSAVYTEENWDFSDKTGSYVTYIETYTKDQYTFTYDEQGRLTKTIVEHGDCCFGEGNKYGQTFVAAELQETVIEHFYGNYAIYEAPVSIPVD